MNFFSFFPILVHTVLLLSLAGLIVSFFLPVYSNSVRMLSAIVLVISMYLEGSIANDNKWKAKVAKLEEAVKVAEAKSKEETVRVETKVVERIKYVRGKTEVVVARVPIYITKEVDRKYPVPNSFVILHDAATRSEVPSSTSVPNDAPSDVKISEVARTVTENYGTCNEVREQLIGWQEWYRAQKKIYESIK